MDFFFPTLFRPGKRRLIHEDMKHHPEGLDQRVKTNLKKTNKKQCFRKWLKLCKDIRLILVQHICLRMCIGDGLNAERLSILKFHFPYHHINIFNAISVFLLQ